MPDTRKRLGDLGEQAALDYLTRQGWRVIARKWRCSAGEIDLVMHDGTALVFVEVRLRRGGHAGMAAESVNAAKQARLARLAYAYLELAGVLSDTSWRIDVIAIDVDRTGRMAINYIRDAVEE